MSDFVSRLAPKINDFIEFKNSLGIQYTSSRYYLQQLDKYNLEHGNYDVLRKDITEGWAKSHSCKTISRDRSWVSPVREFGRYLQSIGHQDNYILDDRFTIQRYSAEVYLMSDNEIQAFFRECDFYVLKTDIPGRKYVYPALFRFMFCCGVRCKEVRNLKCSDVRLDKGFVDILQSKAHRDRRLFLSQELVDYLSRYDMAISECFPSREYFFPSIYGEIISSCSLSTHFRSFWLSAGLKRDGKVKPRAYDFRHHFACANIMRWSIEGKDIHAMLPYLMRYMGHSSLESTYYYIHLIPDYFPQYSALTSSLECLIPEVEDYEV